MDIVLASNRLTRALNSLITMCSFSTFKINLIVDVLPPKNMSLPACIRTISTKNIIEDELWKQNPKWVPPWSQHEYSSKHDTFFNLVRFYIVNMTHLKHVNTFVLIDDDVFVDTNTSKLISYLKQDTKFDAPLTADCNYWDTYTTSPLTRLLFDSNTFNNWQQWLHFIVEWPYDTREILRQTWWNFGFTIVNRSAWIEHRLSHRFNQGVDMFNRFGYPTDSIDFGLVLAQVVFAGHVQCLPPAIINSGLGFSTKAQIFNQRFPASLVHYNGNDKPWNSRRNLKDGDEDYDMCTNRNWNQCGGNHYRGSLCCAPGWKCEFVNDWYSQCVPDRNVRCGQNPFWSQCGGNQFTGHTCCMLGSKCVIINGWYSQCIPA